MRVEGLHRGEQLRHSKYNVHEQRALAFSCHNSAMLPPAVAT